MTSRVSEAVTLQELRHGRVGLVLMGGGAKGAYEVGVWRALWEHGIRRFAVIAGTSVGALNALLIADKTPEEAQRVWSDVVQAGVLQTAHARRSVMRRLFAGYALFLLPVVSGVALLLFQDTLFANRPFAYAVSAILLGGSLLLCTNLMLRLAANGVVIPLLKLKMPQVRTVASAVLLFGIVFAFAKTDWREVAAVVVKLVLPVYLAVFWCAYGGLQIIKTTLLNTPLFARPFLDKTVQALAATATFKHCTGPVWATLSRFSAYQNPFEIPWNFKNYGPMGERSWRFNEKPQRVEWTPFYIDLRDESDASWVLEATSAIPYAFPAVRHGSDTFVDGGLCDNWPVAPALQSAPDIVLVVCVNHRPPVVDAANPSASNGLARWLPPQAGEPTTLGELVRANWRTYLFSDRAHEAEVDRIRDEWVKASARFQGPDNLFNHPVDEPAIGADPERTRFLWIYPSQKTAPSSPIANTVQGTMNFSQPYVDGLIELGYADANRILGQLVVIQSSTGR